MNACDPSLSQKNQPGLPPASGSLKQRHPQGKLFSALTKLAQKLTEVTAIERDSGTINCLLASVKTLGESLEEYDFV